ncbi:putative DD41D transposase [Trichonephila clavipes]|nr:putative DD41D transposase [Trichonephila clavipes]
MSINLDFGSDDIQELLDSQNKELTIDELIEILEQEQHIEEREPLDHVQAEDRMTVGNLTEGLSLIEKGFVEWAQNEIDVVPDFHKRILFSDEAHFWLNGYVNKQNCHIWSEANPQVYVETPLHPEKLTVWCV